VNPGAGHTSTIKEFDLLKEIWHPAPNMPAVPFFRDAVDRIFEGKPMNYEPRHFLKFEEFYDEV
jgi:hypothetical protein